MRATVLWGAVGQGCQGILRALGQMARRGRKENGLPLLSVMGQWRRILTGDRRRNRGGTRRQAMDPVTLGQGPGRAAEPLWHRVWLDAYPCDVPSSIPY